MVLQGLTQNTAGAETAADGSEVVSGEEEQEEESSVFPRYSFSQAVLTERRLRPPTVEKGPEHVGFKE